MPYTAEYRAYRNQCAFAHQRGIEWFFDFESWVTWWESNLGVNWKKLRGPRKGQYVMARRGDKGPYSVRNVDCVTTEENLAARRPNGRLTVGTAVNTCKLTEDQVALIFYDKGSLSEIGKLYGINATAVGKIKRGDSWKHITTGLRGLACLG